MNVDLVQLRWQYVRSVEQCQLLLQENVNLRQQLADFQGNAEAGKNRMMDKMSELTKAHNSNMRKSLIGTKNYYYNQMDAMKVTFVELQCALKKYETRLLKKDEDIENSFKSIQQLYQELADTKSQLAHSNNNLMAENLNKGILY